MHRVDAPIPSAILQQKRDLTEMTWVLWVINGAVVGLRAYEHHRTKQLASAAHTLGFQFQKKADLDPELRGLGFSLFSRGYNTTWGQFGFKPSPCITNVIHGTHLGVSIKVFGYSYRARAVRHSSIDCQTVCLFESNKLPVITPSFVGSSPTAC